MPPPSRPQSAVSHPRRFQIVAHCRPALIVIVVLRRIYGTRLQCPRCRTRLSQIEKRIVAVQHRRCREVCSRRSDVRRRGHLDRDAPSTFGSISTHDDVAVIPPPTATLDAGTPPAFSSCSRLDRAANAIDSSAALAACPRPMLLNVMGTGKMNPPARIPTLLMSIRDAPRNASTPSDPAGMSLAAESIASNGPASPAHIVSASHRYEFPASPHVLSQTPKPILHVTARPYPPSLVVHGRIRHHKQRYAPSRDDSNLPRATHSEPEKPALRIRA